MKLVDQLLDRVSMYRLVLYYLVLLLFVAVVFCILKILPYDPLSLPASALFLIVVAWVTNAVFANAFKAPTNVESVYISALILALILPPIQAVSDLPLLFWAAVLAMASKYILAINQKHIFNPVAVAVTLTALGFNGTASWWIGTLPMLPFSILGLLIVRKLRKDDLVFYSFIGSFMTMFAYSVLQGSDLLTTTELNLTASPLLFGAFVMLTEPLTTPPTRTRQSLYGALVGILFTPPFHIGSFYTTPEQALVIGNVFSYLVSPKCKVIATIKKRRWLSPDTIEILLPLQKQLAFSPGQYMEWTLPHENADSRGTRRYFTIASSPTERVLRLGVKLYPKGSSYKNALVNSDGDMPIVGAQLSGDFTLPRDATRKLAFLAGGIGITPFRSMIKYLIDTRQRRPIVLLYSNKAADEVVYRDVLDEAREELGIRTVYTLTDRVKRPTGWHGRMGRIDAKMIAEEVPDYRERIFYVSGPQAMVNAFEATLKRMGVSADQIKIDFFPGFA
jgi:ferredoxin-NADP reductase/Na+-translocating ferredoxin:NAD+ oxidoreductase RnfD subunit